jgi:predicted CoA-binding protein
MKETVLLIGASNNKERYSNRAMALLLENGHTVIPLNPREEEVLGVRVVSNIGEVTEPISTASVYVRPELLKPSLGALVGLKPRRVILNPGTEDDDIKTYLEEQGVEVIEACTIVMLKTGQF